MSNIQLVRTASGEEVIFKTGTETDETVDMIQPLIIRMVPQGEDQYGLALIPFSHANPEGTHNVKQSYIIAHCELNDNLKRAYIQRTTGIEIASAVEAFANLR
jgi:hypothetical protein